MVPMRGGVLVAVACGLLLLVGVIGLWLFGGGGEQRFTEVTSVERPLPAPPQPEPAAVVEGAVEGDDPAEGDDNAAQAALGSAAPAEAVDPAETQAETPAEAVQPAETVQPTESGPTVAEPSAPSIPAPADLTLVDASPYGPLPKISADGRRPLTAYARPVDLDDPRPKIAIMVLGLGLQADATLAALALPGVMSLQFSPYSTDLASWFEQARVAGHEVLLDLPMEPTDYPASDPGPHTLLADGRDGENLDRLLWVLSRAPGYLAVAGRSGRLANDSERMPPILDVLAARGLGMIEIGTDGLAAAATAAELPYVSAAAAIDASPAGDAIDYALAALEAEALANGSALGVAQAYPISLERLALWARTLDDKGLQLVPASALVIQQLGALEGAIDATSDLARSEN